MTKFTVSQNGKPFTDYDWNEKTKTFSSSENSLVIDFGREERITFRTGSNCTFNTGHSCTFYTGSNCTFRTGHSCAFRAVMYCTFNTGADCTFYTAHSCTFKTGHSCTFIVGKNCFGIRYDVDDVNILPENITVKYNAYEVAGFTKVEQIKQLLDLK